MQCFNELQMRGQAFRDDWCEVEPMYCCFFSRRISELASSLASHSRAVNSHTSISHPILTSSPVTATLQNCESSASRLAVPSRLQRSLLPSRTKKSAIPLIQNVPSLRARFGRYTLHASKPIRHLRTISDAFSLPPLVILHLCPTRHFLSVRSYAQKSA